MYSEDSPQLLGTNAVAGGLNNTADLYTIHVIILHAQGVKQTITSNGGHDIKKATLWADLLIELLYGD